MSVEMLQHIEFVNGRNIGCTPRVVTEAKIRSNSRKSRLFCSSKRVGKRELDC